MATQHSTDSEDLWRRVGLLELRQNLTRVTELIRTFERALGDLPSCDECARAHLLQRIHQTGNQLTSEVMSLAVLAESLRQAVWAADQANVELAQHAPTPCRCPSGPCRCHGA